MASVETSTATGSISSGGNVTLTYPSTNKPFYIENISATLDSNPPAGSGNIVVTIKLLAEESTTSEYDTVISENNLTTLGTSSFLYLPNTPVLCKSGDQIEIKVVNDNSTSRTAYVRIVSRLA